MLCEVEVSAIVHAFDFLEAEGSAEIELHVEGGARIVRQFFLRVLMKLQPVLGEAEAAVPLHPLLLPVFEPLHVGAGLDEELHLHLLEFARSENEIAGRDLVAKCLADLGNAERNLLSRRLLHVQKIYVDPLCRLRPQVHDRGGILYRTHERLEHQIELACCAQRALHSTRRTLRVRRARGSFDSRIVGAKAFLAVFAIDQRIDESADMPARLPHPGMHEDRRIQPLDVVPGANHGVPPAILEIFLEFDAEWAIIPDGSGAAIDLRGLEDEAASLRQGHQLIHYVRVVGHAGKLGGKREAGSGKSGKGEEGRGKREGRKATEDYQRAAVGGAARGLRARINRTSLPASRFPLPLPASPSMYPVPRSASAPLAPADRAVARRFCRHGNGRFQ